MKKNLIIASTLILSLISVANADHVTPEDVVEISNGVRVTQSVAQKINRYNIIDKVIELYNQDIKMEAGIATVSWANDCIVLFINTENNIKNFIEQIHTKESCFK